MSADRERLKSAIQRIARTDPDKRSLLKAAQNKGSKLGSAGVGVSDAERDRICCDGSTSGSANPGTEEREVGDSQSGLNSNDPANIGGGDGTLSGVTDCATGEPICFDGAGFIPPDGWDDPQDPPLSPTYEEGKFWISYAGGGSNLTYYCDTSHPTKGGSASLCVANGHVGQTLCDFQVQISCGSHPCGEDYADGWYCNPPDSEILLDAWPSDGCVNLAIKNGTIVGSKYDPENDSYSAPRDSIDLCDENGNQISLAPSANGGWKTINPTTDNGYLYNSKGEQIAHIDGNEYSDPSV